MKLLSTPLEIPENGLSSLAMNSPDHNQPLPMQARSKLDSSLDTSHFPVDMADMSPFDGSNMLTYESSITPDSSPSPNLLCPHNIQYTGFDAYANPMDSYRNYPAEQNVPIVEFTDLTNPYFEDRRRRKSNPIRDKQTISSMHMRRRAQNRASQRAFRERKEKHAQDLQEQLNELEAKHHELLDSYEKLNATNVKMAEEMACLRERITALQAPDGSDLSELSINGFFDCLNFDQAAEDAESSQSPQI